MPKKSKYVTRIESKQCFAAHDGDLVISPHQARIVRLEGGPDEIQIGVDNQFEPAVVIRKEVLQELFGLTMDELGYGDNQLNRKARLVVEFLT